MITSASPCIGLCKLENDVCIGCKRTKTEITLWSRFSFDQKKEVNKRIFELNKRETNEIQHSRYM